MNKFVENFDNTQNVTSTLYPVNLSTVDDFILIEKLSELFYNNYIEMRNEKSDIVKLAKSKNYFGISENYFDKYEKLGFKEGKGIFVRVQGPDANNVIEAFNEVFQAESFEKKRDIHYKYIKMKWLMEDENNVFGKFEEKFLKTQMISDPLGLHMKSSIQLIDIINNFRSLILIANAQTPYLVDAKSIMEINMLAITYGTECEFKAYGPDAIQAIEAIKEWIHGTFRHG